MNNNPYNRNFMPQYVNNSNQQAMYEQTMYDQIDGQINQLVNMRNQIKNNANMQQNQQQQPTAINQTFQLAPNGGNGMRYASSIEEVSKENVFFDTPYFSKDLSVVWIKKASGDIVAYELNEIVQKDEKDLQIEYLMSQVKELKGMIENEQSYSNVNEKQNETNTSKYDEPIGEPIKKSKSTSVSRVSKSKTE